MVGTGHNNESFEKLYVKYYNEVVSCIFRLVRDYDTAEDLAHDLFCRLYNRQDKIDYGDSRIGGYIHRSARNISIDHIRRNKREENNSNKYLKRMNQNDLVDYSEVEEMCIFDELHSTVKDVLEEFPKFKQDVFNERVFNKKRIFEISSEKKISSYKIKKIEKEIKNRLREKLISRLDPNL